MAAPSANLVAKRKELDEKRAGLANVFKAAGEAGDGDGGLDFKATPVLEMLGASDSMDAVLKVRALNTEIEEIYDAAKELADRRGTSMTLHQSNSPSSVTVPTSAASRPHFLKTRKTSSSRPRSATSSIRSCDSESMMS